MKRPLDLKTRAAGFSLVEMLAVLVLVGVMAGIGVHLIGSGAEKHVSRGAEQVMGLVDRGRAEAIARGNPVMLAAVGGMEAGFDDGVARLGLFELDDAPRDGAVSGRQIDRWHPLPNGVVFLDEDLGDLASIRSAPALEVSWRDGGGAGDLHGVVFSKRGGLIHPPGSAPVAVRLGFGASIDGEFRETGNGGRRSIRIGRVIARPWNLEP